MLDIPDECDGCGVLTVDLTPLGRRELCPTCYRQAIADLELMPYERPENIDPWAEAGE